MDPTTAPPQLYAVYVATSVVLTVALAITLFRNGRTFLRDVFEDRPEMADALNRLLVVGFFMLNAGYALLIFRGDDQAAIRRPADFAMSRIGLLLVTLGLIHFVNMAVFWKIRHRAQLSQLPPPIPPQVLVPPPTPGGGQPPTVGPQAPPPGAGWDPAGPGRPAPPPVAWGRPRPVHG